MYPLEQWHIMSSILLSWSNRANACE